MCGEVPHEDVRLAVRISGNEIRGTRVEHNDAPVCRDGVTRSHTTFAGAVAVGLAATGGNAYAPHSMGETVVQEAVHLAVAVTGNQLARAATRVPRSAQWRRCLSQRCGRGCGGAFPPR